MPSLPYPGALEVERVVYRELPGRLTRATATPSRPGCTDSAVTVRRRLGGTQIELVSARRRRRRTHRLAPAGQGALAAAARPPDELEQVVLAQPDQPGRAAAKGNRPPGEAALAGGSRASPDGAADVVVSLEQYGRYAEAAR